MNEVVCFSCYQINSFDALFCEFCGINLQFAEESYENMHKSESKILKSSKIMLLLTSSNYSFERYFLLYFFPFYLWMVLYFTNSLVFGLIDGNPYLFDLLTSVNPIKWLSIFLYFLIPVLFGFYYIKEQDVLKKRILVSKIVISTGISFMMFLILTFIDNAIYQVYSSNPYLIEGEIFNTYSQIFLILAPITFLLSLAFIGILIWYFKFFNPEELVAIES